MLKHSNGEVALGDGPDDRAAQAVCVYPGTLGGDRLLVLVGNVVARLRPATGGRAQPGRLRRGVVAARHERRVGVDDIALAHGAVAGHDAAKIHWDPRLRDVAIAGAMEASALLSVVTRWKKLSKGRLAAQGQWTMLG